MTLSRLLTAGMVVVVVAGLGCVLAVGVARSPESVPREVAREAAAPDRVAALSVLRTWDRDRAAAWSRSDPGALRRLYVEGSEAGLADRALLAAYADRGLRVTGLMMQRAAVIVESAGERRLVLMVTDRVASARAIGADGGRVSLPRDGWTRHRMVLRLVGERWRVAEVRDFSGDQPQVPT